MSTQLGVQTLAVFVTVVWSGLGSYLILKLLDKIIGLRVSPDVEVLGLDIALHEETGYHKL